MDNICNTRLNYSITSSGKIIPRNPNFNPKLISKTLQLKYGKDYLFSLVCSAVTSSEGNSALDKKFKDED